MVNVRGGRKYQGPTRIASFTRKCHEGMRIQRPGLVVGGFEHRRTAHRGFGRSNQGKVLAREAKKYLPESISWSSITGHCTAYMVMLVL